MSDRQVGDGVNGQYPLDCYDNRAHVILTIKDEVGQKDEPKIGKDKKDRKKYRKTIQKPQKASRRIPMNCNELI